MTKTVGQDEAAARIAKHRLNVAEITVSFTHSFQKSLKWNTDLPNSLVGMYNYYRCTFRIR